jgi:hypothetical protein
MSWKQRKKAVVDVVAAAIAAAAFCAAAQAADLYRWTDAGGGTHYGDKPPKGALNVTRIDVDTASSTMPSRPAAPATPAGAPARADGAAAPAPPDLLTQRRATRARLEANVATAQARLDLARKNLAEAAELQPDEQQVVQQRTDVAQPKPVADTGSSAADGALPQAAHGGMMGMYPNRSNCTTSRVANGKAVVTCPTIIPNQAYLERVTALEDAVRKAEDDLAAAQTAYRRGVD